MVLLASKSMIILLDIQIFNIHEIHFFPFNVDIFWYGYT